jgi:hypothetical protein
LNSTATTVVKSTPSPITACCRLAIDYLDALKNSKIVESLVNELKASIHSLVDVVNSSILVGFQIEIVDNSIDDIEFEIGGSYLPGLKFSEMKSFAIDAIEQAERLSDESLCLDAIRVLVNYGNIVVFSRTNHFLVIRQKKLDELQSSNELVETSTHLVNGDDSCIT